MNTIKFGNLNEPTYLMREAINQLKTNIGFVGTDIKTIMITSSAPNEGKTTVAFELARSLAAENNKVCYVDADLRKSVFTTRYQITSDERRFGLSYILAKEAGSAEPISKTNIPNLDVIVAGAHVPDPTVLLNSERMEKLLEILRDYYDYVLIDTAPLGSVIDAAILAPRCDGTILVVESGGTSRRAAQRVVKQLEIADANILGVVFNKAVTEHKKYYKYSKYYGEY